MGKGGGADMAYWHRDCRCRILRNSLPPEKSPKVLLLVSASGVYELVKRHLVDGLRHVLKK